MKYHIDMVILIIERKTLPQKDLFISSATTKSQWFPYLLFMITFKSTLMFKLDFERYKLICC